MQRFNLSILSAGLMLATGAVAQAADTVSVQQAMTAMRDHAAQTCTSELDAVTKIMADTDRASVLDSAVAVAKDRGSWTGEWPMSPATLKSMAFVEVAKNHAVEQTLLLSFVGHYAGSTDAGDLDATRYQAAVVAAKSELAACLTPTSVELQELPKRLQPAVADVLAQASCTEQFEVSATLTGAALTAPSSDWADAAALAAIPAAKTCNKGS